MVPTPPVTGHQLDLMVSEIPPHAARVVPTTAQPPKSGKGIAISVEVVEASRLGEVSAAWRALVQRAAEPNVFMEPAVVRAAARAGAVGSVWVVLAWDHAAQSPDGRLLGAWAFVVGRLRSRVPIRVLRGPAHDLAFLATPVIDAGHVEPVLTAMLDALTAHASLPKLLMLTELTTDGPVMAALHQVLRERGSSLAFLKQGRRPALRLSLKDKLAAEGSLSAGTRKKLRQHRRRLAKHGPVAIITHSGPEAVSAALEEFLRMEASGWKGRRGTALLSDERASRYTREFIGDLARDGLATIETLRVGNQSVAMQVLLRSGAGAFTWKVAYDETFHDFSPGILLLQDLTAALVADPDVTVADSCSYDEEGYMADFWKERQPIADVLIGVRRGPSLSFATTALCERGYRSVRGGIKAVYMSMKHSIRRVQSRRRAASPV